MLSRASTALPLRTAVRCGSFKNVNIKNPSASDIPFQGKVAGDKPISVKLEAEKLYAFCSCAESAKQPFCDGSHKGRSIRRPIRFTVDKTDNYMICMCKQSKKLPLCDGTHRSVPHNNSTDKPTVFVAFGNSPVYDGVARQLGYKYKNGGFQ